MHCFSRAKGSTIAETAGSALGRPDTSFSRKASLYQLLSVSIQVLDVGCSYNHMYRLTRPEGSTPAEAAGSALGKLEIKWRGSMGEVGRLQTQQILGAPAPAKVAAFAHLVTWWTAMVHSHSAILTAILVL